MANLESNIRKCYTLYVSFLKANIKNLENIDQDDISIEQIDNHLDVLHLRYILSHTYSLSPDSVGMMAYRHLKQMIEEYNIKSSVPTADGSVRPTKSRGWFK